MFPLQTSFKPEVIVNSKEENSWDFCPNTVQEFGLCFSAENSDLNLR